MSGALHKTMVYLGLAEADTRYDQGHEAGGDSYADGGYGAYDDYSDTGYADEQIASVPAAVTPITKNTAVATQARFEANAMSRINTIHPRTYNEAKDIGESFRAGVPVIMNLSDMDDTDAKRLVDFAAGLVFGLHGTIERVTAKVFLLSPAGVEVSSSQADAAAANRGLFNQS